MEIITLTKAGKLIGLSKEQMKKFVDLNGLTKITLGKPTHRYLLYLDEVLEGRAIMENDNKKIPKVEEHLLSALKEAEKEKRAQRISEGKKLAKQKREQEKQKSAT